jgi:protease IV
MWSFFKTFFASLLALVVFVVLFVVFLVALVAGLSSSDLTPVADNSVLKISLDRPILEREVDNPFAELNIPGSEPPSLGLVEIKKAIAHARQDDKIKGILLNLTELEAGIVTVEEIRQALVQFKTSGKFVYAYSEYMSEGAYYLSSVADSVFLNPVGLMEFNGLSSEYMFFKGTLEKLDLKPEIFKVGDYKSAVEPLLFEKMSVASREQTTSFLYSIQNTMYRKIAEARKVPLERLNVIADSMLVRKPLDAVRLGLVDNVLYYDQVETLLKSKMGVEDKESLQIVGFRKYADKLEEAEPTEEEADKKTENKIVVIVAQGEIGSGRGDEESIGSDKISEELRAARKDENVKAIVLRINSPGGSSMASDVMWREVKLAAETKPLIASMGDVAASGGYYMAMAADTIVAEAHTITGSIGVFGVMLDAQGFFKNKLGITFDGVKTGKFSDVGSFSRPLTDYERKVIQQEVEDIYTDFVTKAAEGRNLPLEDLKKVASGRVWTGEQAKDRGLVDVLGGFDKAVMLAAEAAKLGADYELVYMPSKKDFFERLMHDFQDRIKMVFSSSSATFALEKTYSQLVKKYNGVQARLPFDIKIK